MKKTIKNRLSNHGNMKKQKNQKQKIKVAPLSSSFFLVSILGCVFSVLYVYPRDKPLGASFAILCVLMFIASIISMTYAPSKMEEDIDKLETQNNGKN